MVVDVVKAVPFTAVVETGTYRGATTAFLQETTHLPVFTVEIHPRFYNYSRLRFRREPEITVVEGDSRSYLAELAMDRSFPRDRVLFYLDAHWNVADQSAEPPLLEELRTIAQHWTESVVIVDDFAVPDDPQYGFDVYGPGVELSTEFVSPEEIGSPNLFWPAAPGLEETGARRGCVIFAYGKDVTARLARLTSLRRT